jgi:RsmE family RNA methyltransferase
MNLLLLRPEELAPDGTARVAGRRLLHAREVLRAAQGEVLRVGVLGGKIGTGEVLALTESELVLRPILSERPPPRPGVSLLLAMPRPKALRRVLPAIASLGIDRVVLLNAARVEKSYFESKVIESIEELLVLGLEQARDTILPGVIVRERFRPFVEDELESMFQQQTTRLLAHPAAASPAPRVDGQALIAIGPEGGWVPFEIDLLEQRGFTPFTLGPRALRVEVAVPYALGAVSRSRINP